MQSNLYCMRLRPDTDLKKVAQYLDSIFEQMDEDNSDIKAEILNTVEEFKECDCYGRITFFYETGRIEIREDGIEI